MNRCYLLLAVAGTALIVGCASADNKQAAVDDDDKEFVTGSRIPVKQGAGNVSKTTNRQDIDNMMNRRSVAPGGTGN